jgi:Holliday junction resolvasome RuvABC endonuclease subunit
MKGVAAEVLYRLTGAYIAAIPMNADFVEIHNITLKRDLTGHGKADKAAIALALVGRFAHDEKSLDIIKNLTDNNNEDAIDAIAIAVCREVHK